MVHPQRWAREVRKECDTFGVDRKDCDTALPSLLIRRNERDYALCDNIVVPSTVARRSFDEEGYSNVEVVLPGIDADFFSPFGYSSFEFHFSSVLCRTN